MKLRIVFIHSFLAVALYLATYYINVYNKLGVSNNIVSTIVSFFAITHLFTALYFTSILQKDDKKRTFLTIVVRSAKFVLTLFFALSFVLIDKEHAKHTGLLIVILYAFYTVFELLIFKKIQNKSK